MSDKNTVEGAKEKIETHWVDRSGWPAGEWDKEPDRLEWRDEVTKLPCLIVRSEGGNLCGYVGVPPGHLLHGKDYDAAYDLADLHVHGGLTYSGRCGGHVCHVPAPGEPDNVWWLGFDCAHSGDYRPSDARWGAMHFREDEYRDVAYVRKECAELAAQLVIVLGSLDSTSN